MSSYPDKSIHTTPHCHYCSGTNNILLFPTYDIFGEHYFIYRCNSCKAYFLYPCPTEEMLIRAYDATYYGEKEEKFFLFFEKILDYFRYRRSAALCKYLNDGAKILDIGCGNGRFLLYLLKFGNYKLYGTELESNSSRRASRISQINLKIGDLEENDFPDKTFDAITLIHVFEHLKKKKKTLTIISKIIKNDGVLVISFPNISSFQSKLFKGKWTHLDPPRHLFFFAPDDFIQLMNGYGFDLIRQKYFSIEQNPFSMLQGILNIFCSKRELLLETLKGNKEYSTNYSHLNIFFQIVFFIITFPLFIFTDIFESMFRKGATVQFTFKKRNSDTST